VSVSGDAVVVGAARDDGPATDSGSAYVFARSGGIWIEHQKLLAPDAAFSDWFGSAVCVSGDTVVVGAMLDETPLGSLAGSAHVFRRQVPVELQSFTVE
jgi:FG-GAP repeat